MMKPLDKRFLHSYIIINFLISFLIVLVLWYSGSAIEGVWFKVNLILGLPGFLIIALTRGMNNAMHFTTENTFRCVNFIFYSLLIAFIQTCIHKHKMK